MHKFILVKQKESKEALLVIDYPGFKLKAKIALVDDKNYIIKLINDEYPKEFPQRYKNRFDQIVSVVRNGFDFFIGLHIQDWILSEFWVNDQLVFNELCDQLAVKRYLKVN
jgi:hypothetical protein